MVSPVQSQVEDFELIEFRRAQIVEAATQLFGRKGYNETTIRDIAKHAGFSTGLIYSYVKCKEDVLFLVISWALDHYLQDIPLTIRGIDDAVLRLRGAFKAYCRIAASRPNAILVAYRDTKSLSPSRRDEIKSMELASNKLLAACYTEGVEQGLFLSLDPDLVAYQMILLAHGWALKSWFFARITTLDNYIDNTLELLLRGLFTPVGTEHDRKRKAAGSEEGQTRS